MSRFKKLSHTLWHCQYHIVWTTKYRLRILEGEVSQDEFLRGAGGIITAILKPEVSLNT